MGTALQTRQSDYYCSLVCSSSVQYFLSAGFCFALLDLATLFRRKILDISLNVFLPSFRGRPPTAATATASRANGDIDNTSRSVYISSPRAYRIARWLASRGNRRIKEANLQQFQGLICTRTWCTEHHNHKQYGTSGGSFKQNVLISKVIHMLVLLSKMFL